MLAMHFMHVTLLCQQCGQPFEVKFSRKDSARFCSQACHTLAQRLPEETRLCAECGQPFLVPHYTYTRRHQIYCSIPCANIGAGRSRRGKNLQRFWSRVARCEHGDDCPFCCWNWQGPQTVFGYGRIVVRGTKQTFAHRIAWELHNQLPLADNDKVAHYCHNTICCNPNHLHAGTQLENIADSVRDNRHTFGERNAQHKLTEEQIREIFRLRREGWSLAAIAKPMGVTFQTIHKIVTGARWAHVVIHPKA